MRLLFPLSLLLLACAVAMAWSLRGWVTREGLRRKRVQCALGFLGVCLGGALVFGVMWARTHVDGAVAGFIAATMEWAIDVGIALKAASALVIVRAITWDRCRERGWLAVLGAVALATAALLLV